MAILTIDERDVKILDVLNMKCPQNVYIVLGKQSNSKQDNAKQVKTKKFKASKITHF